MFLRNLPRASSSMGSTFQARTGYIRPVRVMFELSCSVYLVRHQEEAWLVQVQCGVFQRSEDAREGSRERLRLVTWSTTARRCDGADLVCVESRSRNVVRGRKHAE